MNFRYLTYSKRNFKCLPILYISSALSHINSVVNIFVIIIYSPIAFGVAEYSKISKMKSSTKCIIQFYAPLNFLMNYRSAELLNWFRELFLLRFHNIALHLNRCASACVCLCVCMRTWTSRFGMLFRPSCFDSIRFV